MTDNYGTVFMGTVVEKEAEIAHGLPHIEEKCIVADKEVCPLCGGKLEAIANFNFHLFNKESQSLHKCSICGLAVFR